MRKLKCRLSIPPDIPLTISSSSRSPRLNDGSLYRQFRSGRKKRMRGTAGLEEGD